MIDNRLVDTEDLVIILPVYLSMTLTICYILLYVFGQTGLSKQCRPRWDTTNAASHQGLHCLPLIQLFLDTTFGSKVHLFKFSIKYGKELRILKTKGKCGKVTGTEKKWYIISKSVRIIVFVVFVDQLINYPINCASLIYVPSKYYQIISESMGVRACTRFQLQGPAQDFSFKGDK